MMDVQEIRRRFAALSDELRNQGLNSLEAVGVVASLLSDGTRLETLGSLSIPGSRIAENLLSDERLDAGTVAVAFQEFVTSQARYGLGQYLTPLPVAQLIATVVGQRLATGLVLDPFAGVGLLLEALGEHSPQLDLLAVEINATVAAVATALSSMSRHEMKVVLQDSVLAWCGGSLPQCDAVVTNPPFGAQVTTADHEMLREAGVSPELLAMKSIPAELLGLELSLSVLKTGGFLGIVLPQSVLTNAGWNAYRRSVFSRLEILAVVSLPEETFAPFRGVAKACLVFGTKVRVSLPQSVPFVRSMSVGYDDTGRVGRPSDLAEVNRLIDAGVDLFGLMDDVGRFVPPSSNERGHDIDSIRLGDIADVFRGRNPDRDSYVSDGPWLLKVGGLAGSFIPWRSARRNRIPSAFLNKHRALRLLPGDICLTGAAHRPRYIGLKVDLVDIVPPEGALPSAEVIVVRLRPDSPFAPVDLLLYLRSELGYRQLQDLVRGSTAHLYPRDLDEIRLPRLDRDPSATVARELFQKAAIAYRQYRHYENQVIETVGRSALPDLDE